MTSVQFLTEGGKNVGFGHLTRCLALCQAFEEMGISPELVISGDMSAKAILGERKFHLDPWVEEQAIFFQNMGKRDIVIVDSYRVHRELYDKITEKARIPVYVDDNGEIETSQGVLINWNLYAHGLGYTQKREMTHLLGPEYACLRKPFWDVAEKKIHKSVNSVLVTFGGDDSKHMTPVVLRILTKDYPAVTKNIVIGRAFKKTGDIMAAADDNTNLIQAPDAEGMKKLMLDSDLAISSGGQTLFELARVGLPAIVVGVAENQRRNIQTWQKNKLIEFAGFWEEKSLVESIRTKFLLFMDHEKRRQSRDAGRSLVTGSGARKIAGFLQKKLHRSKPSRSKKI
jgi:UDP-2,4-diacetamido-2,4,6-trideoxy-beta-L-altropyranose hydrolase